MNLLHDFEIRPVPALAKSTMPPPDDLTKADKIFIRMLLANSTELEHYQQSFANLNSRFQVCGRFMENYAQPDKNSCVHAEVQVLEHFYAQKMDLAGDDPYIAWSKPACFCCLLYFRHHPGHFVEPVSHNKIYLNWRPPDFNLSIDTISPNHLRDTLNAMNEDIRKEALRQIHGQIAPKAWHPYSITGVTESAQDQEVCARAKGMMPPCAASMDPSLLKSFVNLLLLRKLYRQPGTKLQQDTEMEEQFNQVP
jgi:hypothetical protein